MKFSDTSRITRFAVCMQNWQAHKFIFQLCFQQFPAHPFIPLSTICKLACAQFRAGAAWLFIHQGSYDRWRNYWSNHIRSSEKTHAKHICQFGMLKILWFFCVLIECNFTKYTQCYSSTECLMVSNSQPDQTELKGIAPDGWIFHLKIRRLHSNIIF